MQHFMVSTVSAACACRCIAAVSCALPVVPGAIWRKRVRSGVRSSSARRLCSGLQATGSASPTAASRRRGCPGSQQQPATARQIPQHYVRLPQHAQTSPSISLPSRLRYQAATAKYLQQRGISLELAQQLGVGYAALGTWPHTARDWRGGRVVFPHTPPDGSVVNLYGRAVALQNRSPRRSGMTICGRGARPHSKVSQQLTRI